MKNFFSTMLIGFVLLVFHPLYAYASDTPRRPDGLPEKGDRWLLVIGIDTYQNFNKDNLETPVKDAVAFNNILSTCYYFSKVRPPLLNKDATRDNILNEFEYLKKNVREDDFLVIFFAGHGTVARRMTWFEGYWLPYDAKPEEERTWISNNDVVNYLSIANGIKAQHILLISDACFSGTLLLSGQYENIPEKKWKKRISRLAITSGAVEEVSDMGPEGHSIFSYYLLKALEMNDKSFIYPSDIFDYIQSGLVANGWQEAKIGIIKDTGGQSGAEMYFNMNPDCLKEKVMTGLKLDLKEPYTFMTAGETKSIKSFAEYNQGADQDVTFLAQWKTGDPTVAVVSAGGTLSVAGEGKTKLTVNFNGFSAEADVRVVFPHPKLTLSDTGMDVTVTEGESTTKTFRIKNTGTGTLSYELKSAADWVGLTPEKGSLEGGREDEIQLKITPGNMNKGIYQAVISATGENAENGPSILEIKLNVVASGPVSGKNWTEPVTGMEFMWIPGGCYMMGQTEKEKDYLIKDAGEEIYKNYFNDEQPRHNVCVDGFWMGKTEVTAVQFEKFVSAKGYETEAEKEKDKGCYGLNTETNTWELIPGTSWRNPPGFEKESDHPVVCVSWNDAEAFVDWLSEKSGGKLKYRLPTEAQWEYAARGGTETMRYWGDNPDDACRYANVADQTAKKKFSNWRIHDCNDGYVFTAPAGSYLPNNFGLNDMLGNVWEWCSDVYASDAYTKHTQKNPEITSGGSSRVTRGGGWFDYAGFVRSAYRCGFNPAYRGDDLGFRLALPLE